MRAAASQTLSLWAVTLGLAVVSRYGASAEETYGASAEETHGARRPCGENVTAGGRFAAIGNGVRAGDATGGPDASAERAAGRPSCGGEGRAAEPDSRGYGAAGDRLDRSRDDAFFEKYLPYVILSSLAIVSPCSCAWCVTCCCCCMRLKKKLRYGAGDSGAFKDVP